MASIPSSAIFLISLLIFTALNPPAHGNTTILQGLSVTGRLCCTSTGNCPGQGVPRANVTLSCPPTLNGSASIGQNITSANGNFTIAIPRVTGLLLPVPPCTVIVRLPLNSTVCPLLSTAIGRLVSAIRSTGIANIPPLGLVLNATIVVFIRVPV